MFVNFFALNLMGLVAGWVRWPYLWCDCSHRKISQLDSDLFMCNVKTTEVIWEVKCDMQTELKH